MKCGMCDGRGSIDATSAESTDDTIPCPWCDGTGQEPPSACMPDVHRVVVHVGGRSFVPQELAEEMQAALALARDVLADPLRREDNHELLEARRVVEAALARWREYVA